jgi:glycosyltransferase involved in cell wall biosynthesis
VKIVLTNSIIYKYALGAPDAIGGAERFQWLLAKALTEAGWSVVIGVRTGIAPDQQQVIDGVRFVGMQQGHFVRAWWKFLDEQKPDWWFWRAADPLWAVLLLIAKLKGVRAIFSAAYDTDVNPRVALFRRRRSWPLYAWGLSKVDRIFVQHFGQYQNLSNKLQRKAEVLPGIVAIPDDVKSRRERGNYIVWVASLRPHKRPDLLVELARRTPEIHYVVCGGKSTFGTPAEFSETILRNLHSLQNIEHLGDVPHPRVLEIIASAMALVSTSDMEGFPNIFLEAWASGTPVISMRIDPDGVIRKEGLGFVSGNLDNAVSDVRNLLMSEEVFETISHKARAHAEMAYSGSAVVKAFEKTIVGKNHTMKVKGEMHQR